MAAHECELLTHRIRCWLTLFIIGLVISGLTAFPLEWEVGLLHRWVAGPGALMVNPHDTTEIADAMVAVTQDPVLADRLRVSGQRRAAEFSWERAAEETLRVVEAAARKSLGRHPPDKPARPGTPALSSSR